MNNIYNFWEEWTDLTPIEIKAIESVLKARDCVIKSIPLDKLVAIYVKGSMARREMNEQSDVDMVPIVTESEYEDSVFNVNDLDLGPVMVVPLSLEEFKKNRLDTETSKAVDLRAKPDRLLRMIDTCKLIHGQAVNPADYPIRSDQQAFIDEKEVIKNGYIPYFLDGTIGFSPLLKEFFWMTEMEFTSKGVVVPHTFRGIASVAPEDHLIHEALRLRETGQVDRETGLGFIEKLQKFLA